MSPEGINRFVADPVVSMVGLAVVMHHGKLAWAGSAQQIPRGVLELDGEPVTIHLNPITYDRLADALSAHAPVGTVENDNDPEAA